jgi:hypothetical protein
VQHSDARRVGKALISPDSHAQIAYLVEQAEFRLPFAKAAGLQHEMTYQRKKWAPYGVPEASLPAVQHCGIFMIVISCRDD